MTKCPYCGGRCVDYFLRTDVSDFLTQTIEGDQVKFVMIYSEVIDDGRPHCVDCGAVEFGQEVLVHPDLTSEELMTGWYRGSYTLEETFR